MPMFVRFRDLSDPTSVEKVDSQDFAASFGEGVKLKRVWIEMTDDSVTKSGIRNKVPRLNKLNGGYLHSGNFSQAILYPAKWQLNQPSPAARRASPKPASALNHQE